MADEARALLDQLMGGDRNEPLPQDSGSGGAMRQRGGRKKSCYDPDICPLYCAWPGVDVYELFTNTKSDLGENPHLPDQDAMAEYQSLPAHEQDRLGFQGMLTEKLAGLVKSCNRTVSRNKEKLKAELARQAQKRGTPTFSSSSVDPVQDVSPELLQKTARDQVELEFLEEAMQQKLLPRLHELDRQMEELYQKRAAWKASERKDEGDKEPTESASPEKPEPDKDTPGGDEKKEEEPPQEDAKTAAATSTPNQEKADETDDTNKDETTAGTNEAKKDDDNDKPVAAAAPSSSSESALDEEWRTLQLEQQALVWDLTQKLQAWALLQPMLEKQTRQLLSVKSDVVTDKTVCEVSGNFMSARDADERIAAHYAGKQYVGWKLVRTKFAELQQQQRHGGRPGRPPQGSFRGDDHHRRRSRSRERDAGRRHGGRRRSPSPPRWERDQYGGGGRDHRGGGGRHDDRGGGYGGGYDNRRGYDSRRDSGYRRGGGDRGRRW